MRLKYIDALRGLAIFIVVYCHYIGFKMDLKFTSYMSSFLTSFFIPLFFFISGFCVYKMHIPKNYFHKKIINLFIPTVIILLLSTFIWNSNFLSIIQKPGTKGGYWFTYTLFQMTILYGAIKIIKIERFFKNLYIIEFIYITYWLLICILYKLSFNTSIGNILSSSMLFYNLPFFILGIYFKKYLSISNHIINSQYFLLIIFIFSFINLFINVHYIITYTSRVILMYTLFYKKQSWIQNNIIGKFLATLGENSIEIYFLHYFLLFTPPMLIKQYLNSIYTGNNYANEIMVSFVELTIMLPIITYISYTCIYIKKIISNIPFISKLMFGK